MFKKNKLKIFITLLLLSLYCLSFYLEYDSERISYINEFNQIESNIPNTYQIMLPTAIDNRNREDTYNELIRILDKYDASIYYDRLSNDKKLKIKYIYDKHDKYISHFHVKSGQSLNNDLMTSNKYISTKNTDDINQIGIIANFDKSIDINIETLQSMLDSNFNFSGSCYVSFNNEIDVRTFLSDLGNSLNVDGLNIIEQQKINLPSENNYNFIIILIYFLIILLSLYDLLNSYKVIGVKRLLGYSSKIIYYENIIILIKANLLTSFFSILAMTFIFFNQFNIYVYKFLFKIIGIISIEIIILSLIYLFSYLYISKNSIPNMLKGKKDLKFILLLSYFSKLLFLVLLIHCIYNTKVNITYINTLHSNLLNNWSKLEDFAIIPTAHLTNDELSNDTFFNTQKQIYNDFNANGAILADFNEYSPSVRSIRMQETSFFYESDNVIINPNYLKTYLILDENNNPISISENETKFILLVPDKYKTKKDSILDYSNLWKESSYYSTSKDQSTEIIWIKSDQKIFSASVDINPNDGNTVLDPIIHVITQNNASIKNYDFILARNGNPLKIKSSNNNYKQEIHDVFNKYNAEKYISTISKANEQVDTKIDDIKNNLKRLFAMNIVLLIIVFIIIINSIYIYFDYFKKIILIKTICGYKIISKYLDYFVSILIGWNIVFCIGIKINEAPLNSLTIFVACGICVELLFSLIILIINENSKSIELLR